MKKFIVLIIVFFVSVKCFSDDYERIFHSSFSTVENYETFLQNEREYISHSDYRWLYQNPKDLYRHFIAKSRESLPSEILLSPTIVFNKAETDAFWVLSNKEFSDILLNNQNNALVVSDLLENGRGFRFYISGLSFSNDDTWYKNYKSMLIFIDYIPNSNIENVGNRFEISFIQLMDYDFEAEYLQYFPESDGIIKLNRKDVYGTVVD